MNPILVWAICCLVASTALACVIYSGRAEWLTPAMSTLLAIGGFLLVLGISIAAGDYLYSTLSPLKGI